MLELLRPNKKKKKGFTLVELIIVIAILAILAAILVPSMIGYINEAKDSVGNANARTVYSAASAALAMALAKGNPVVNGKTTAMTAAELIASESTTQKQFEVDIGTLLGSTFKGKITVDVSGAAAGGGTSASQTIGNVTWQDAGADGAVVGKVYTYTAS